MRFSHFQGTAREIFRQNFQGKVRRNFFCNEIQLLDSPAVLYEKCKNAKNTNFNIFNPQAPVAQKAADEVVFRRFQGEGGEFF